MFIVIEITNGMPLTFQNLPIKHLWVITAVMVGKSTRFVPLKPSKLNPL
jgi:hypothetical protein